MEENHRSVRNLPADTSKANPGSQKAVPSNAWLLAQGSYKRPKPLLIKPQQAKLQQSWQASKKGMQAGRPSISQMHNSEGCQLESTQRNYYGPPTACLDLKYASIASPIVPGTRYKGKL